MSWHCFIGANGKDLSHEFKNSRLLRREIAITNGIDISRMTESGFKPEIFEGENDHGKAETGSPESEGVDQEKTGVDPGVDAPTTSYASLLMTPMSNPRPLHDSSKSKVPDVADSATPRSPLSTRSNNLAIGSNVKPRQGLDTKRKNEASTKV